MSMLERVGRAVHAAKTDAAIDDWDMMPESERRPYRNAARRIVAAMLVPTDEMIAEGKRRDLPRDAANIWERMVFRALVPDVRHPAG